MKAGIKATFKIRVKKFAIYKLPINPQTNSGCWVNNSGPGVNPHRIIPPRRMAVVGDPGIPNVSIGSILPVLAELLAHSGATTPAGTPVPKSFEFLDSFNDPNLFRVYPHKTLCDNLKCFVSNKDELFYFDSEHLSVSGASKLTDLIIKKIEQIKF